MVGLTALPITPQHVEEGLACGKHSINTWLMNESSYAISALVWQAFCIGCKKAWILESQVQA